jgi:type I restriction enzyme S subunit
MKIVELGSLVDILSGFAFDSKLFNDSKNGIPLIRIRDVGKNFSKTYYPGDYDNKFLVKKGDFLIGMDGDFRLSEWKGMDALLNQRVCKIAVKKTKELTKEYLLHFLPKELKLIEDTTSFATVKHLSVKKIQEIQIPLPPLETQQKIASILDAADTLRQKDKALLAKYDELTQALFLDMFGDIILNNKLFNIYKVSDVCRELFLGLTSKVDYVETGGFPLVRATDINKGVLDLRNVKYISEVQHKKLTSRRITKRGDILISKSGSLGTCAIVNTDIHFSTYESIFTVRVNEEFLNNTFLVYLIRNDSFQRKLLGNQVGGTVAHLNLNMFRDFEFPLPPLNLQTQFAERVANIEQQKAIAKASLEKSEELFNSLLQKAFKGEL